MMLALCAVHEAAAKPEFKGWPEGTLIHNVNNGRRGRVGATHGDRVMISFCDDNRLWPTTWDVVIRNYQPVCKPNHGQNNRIRPTA